MRSKWWTFLQTKPSLNIMVVIYIYVLKALHWSTFVIHNSLVHGRSQVSFHSMRCFINSCLMKTYRMFPQHLHTSNILLNCWKPYNVFWSYYNMGEYRCLWWAINTFISIIFTVNVVTCIPYDYLLRHWIPGHGRYIIGLYKRNRQLFSLNSNIKRAT